MLGQCCNRFETIFKSLWDMLEVTSGHLWNLKYVWDNVEIILGQLRSHVGIMLKSVWNIFTIWYATIVKKMRQLWFCFLGGGQFWNHVGAILKIRLRYSSNMMGKFWNHFGTMLKSWWINFEIILGQLWNLYWTILKSFLGQVWNHVGTILKSFWNNFGILLG